jgi:hypothetical protein
VTVVGEVGVGGTAAGPGGTMLVGISWSSGTPVPAAGESVGTDAPDSLRDKMHPLRFGTTGAARRARFRRQTVRRLVSCPVGNRSLELHSPHGTAALPRQSYGADHWGRHHPGEGIDRDASSVSSALQTESQDGPSCGTTTPQSVTRQPKGDHSPPSIRPHDRPLRARSPNFENRDRRPADSTLATCSDSRRLPSLLPCWPSHFRPWPAAPVQEVPPRQRPLVQPPRDLSPPAYRLQKVSTDSPCPSRHRPPGAPPGIQP